ncbi:MAG: four helix bundle protein [Bacteroidota bacterium]
METNIDRSSRDFLKRMVWQKAPQWVDALTENFSKHEVFDLKSPLQRSMVSVPANISLTHLAPPEVT